MRLCDLQGCERRHYSRGWCEAHYARWRKHRDPGPARVIVTTRTPTRSGCGFAQCDSPHYARGYCEVHYQRWRKHGDTSVVLSSATHTRRVKAQHHNWFGDDVGYRGAHHRVTRERGPAALWSCDHCGGDAMDWAYDHEDIAEQVDHKGRVFSSDPGHYIPLCRVCHAAFDRGYAFS